MSTILKALRRLEEDERAQAPVSLDEALLETPAPERDGPRTGALVATVSVALVGVIAVAWSLSGLWLPGSDEHFPEPIPVAPVAVEVQIVESEATNPAPVSEPVVVIPASPPSQERVEVFPKPDEIRREMQRLVGGAIQRAEQQAAEAAAAAELAAQEVPEPKPAAVAVADTPPEPVVAPTPPEPAVEPVRTEVVKTSPPPEPSPPQPVAESRAVEIQPSPVADFAVQEIIWHPNPARRVVVVQIAGAAPRSLGEGDENGGFKVIEIGLSDVELLHGGEVFKQGISAN